MPDEKTPYEKALARFAANEQENTYDIGFYPPDVEDPIQDLGRAAINVETIQESADAQISKYLAQAQTAAAMTQGSINSGIYDKIQEAQALLRGIQQPLEQSIAMQMGRAFEAANQVAPHDSVVQTVINRPDPEWAAQAQAAQWAQAAMGSGSIGTSPTPPGAIPPPIIPPPSPLPPTPPPTTPIAPGGCMSIEEGTRWICDNKPWLSPPPPYAGGPNPIDVMCTQTPNGEKYYLRWYYPANVTTNAPIFGSRPGLVSDGPYGASAFVIPSCTDNPPPIPPIIPPNPPPPDGNCPPQIPCPPVKECPPCPPPKEPPCIKICKDETECKETEYVIYCTDGGVSYIVKKDEPPHSGSDRRVTSGPGSKLDLSQIVKECSKRTDETPSSGGSSSPLVFTPSTGCDGLVMSVGITPPSDGKWIEHLLSLKFGLPGTNPNTGDTVVDAIAKWVANNLLPGATSSLDTLIEGVVRWLSSAGCNSGTAYATVAGKAIAGLASRVLGRATDPVETVLEYSYNSQCPYKLPTPEEATRAFLSNTIDADRLKCLVEANGQRWDTWTPLVDAARTRLNTQETIVGWKRGIIDTQWADDNLRALGYLPGPETEILKELANQIPPMSELIGMMMRDVADETNIDWSESDATFRDKWTGQLREWGQQQGVPDKYAQYVWRAHWVVPAPQQLLEFYRRLRHKGTLGTEQELYKKVRQALIQQDILPQWIDAFLQTSYRPLTRVDTRRAYEIGAIGESDLFDSYVDQGYSDVNANRLVAFTKKQQIERAKRSPLIKRYATGELTFDDLELELQDSGFSPEMIEIATSKAQRELRYRRRKVCLAAMKKRYLLGEYKFLEIRDKIQSEGIDPSQAEEIAKGWECEKQRKGKAVPAQTLCEWYTLGVITDVDMYTRLLNLGYDQDDAAKLTQSCRTRLGLKIQKDQQKALAVAKANAAANARSARQAADHLENEVNKVARANAKRLATKQRRQKLLLEGAKKFADRNLISYVDAAIGIEAAISAAIAGNLSDVDTIYQTALIAAGSEECDTLDCFSRLLGELLIQSEVTV